MPKKATTARSGSGAQRNKAKTQKSFEVVRQNIENQERTGDEQFDAAPISALDTFASVPSMSAKSTRRNASQTLLATQDVETENEVSISDSVPEVGIVPASTAKRTNSSEVGIVPASLVTENTASEVEVAAMPVAKGSSASARLAARRGQKLQPRTPVTLVTAEHYSYVRRDLMIIAVLASIMFIAIIVLYFTIGRG